MSRAMGPGVKGCHGAVGLGKVLHAKAVNGESIGLIFKQIITT